jgi:hypothetical protein
LNTVDLFALSRPKFGDFSNGVGVASQIEWADRVVKGALSEF